VIFNSSEAAVMSQSLKYKKPNALKHGVFAAAAILPGENAEEFHDLHASLIAEWTPEGATEHEFVITMAQAVWAKRRRQKHSEVRVFENMLNPEHASFNEDLGLLNLAAALQTEPETAFQAYGSRLLRPNKIKEFEREFPCSEFENETDRAKSILKYINAQLARQPSLPDGLDIVGLHQTFATVSLEVFRQEIELDERLNAMFHRAMKGLIECKAMKQILRETTTRQNAIEPPEHTFNEVNGGGRKQ
jgi:hypothetical protein